MRAQPTYEIRIAGRLDETTLAAFAGLEVTYRDEETLITGQFDQAALHGMLEMIRSLGLDLLEARRVPSRPASAGVRRTSPDSGAGDRQAHRRG